MEIRNLHNQGKDDQVPWIKNKMELANIPLKDKQADKL